jgi:protein-S-isoprenylcysteine O-methyltransferase Ste14
MRPDSETDTRNLTPDTSSNGSDMAQIGFLVYGVVAYVLFLLAIVYGIGFVADFDWVPKGINDGPHNTISKAITINVSLLALFAVQHNVMARPWFKRWWTRFVPEPIERSTFVAVASLLLLLLYWQWRPIPEVVWQVDSSILWWVLMGLYWAGWGIVFYSSFLIDHFELFGLKQVWQYFNGRPHASAPFSERSIYRWMRHPLMFGFVVAFWSAPTMTLSRLLFALVSTLWILIAIRIEEHDLADFLGEPYRDYRSRTSMLLPIARRRQSTSSVVSTDN